MDTDEIEVFLILAEELHFTRTAERLRLPQSRVSRLVASLERRVVLIPLGKRLYGRVAPAYAELAEAGNEARDRARNIDGSLRLGARLPSVARGREAKTKYEVSGEVEYVPAVHSVQTDAGMPGLLPWSWYQPQANRGT